MSLDPWTKPYLTEFIKSLPLSYPKTPFRRIIMAGCFQAAAGAIGMTTSFFLIVTSSTVIDLLLNFTGKDSHASE